MTLTRQTWSRIELADILGPVITFFAVLTIDAGRMVSAIQANSSTFKLAFCVQTFPLSFNLRIEKTFISMTKALATFAFIGRNELSWTPQLLIVHGTTLVTQWSACIMTTLTLVILKFESFWIWIYFKNFSVNGCKAISANLDMIRDWALMLSLYNLYTLTHRQE